MLVVFPTAPVAIRTARKSVHLCCYFGGKRKGKEEGKRGRDEKKEEEKRKNKSESVSASKTSKEREAKNEKQRKGNCNRMQDTTALLWVGGVCVCVCDDDVLLKKCQE